MAHRERVARVEEDSADLFEATRTRRRLENSLTIDKHALDEAWIAQPGLFYEVAEELALTISRRDAAKQAVKIAEAEADSAYRSAAAREGEKTTETQVAKAVLIDPGVKAASDRLLAFEVEVAKLSALREAFMQRSTALKELVSLHLASYYSNNNADSRSGHGAADMLATRAREEMNKARRRRD